MAEAIAEATPPLRVSGVQPLCTPGVRCYQEMDVVGIAVDIERADTPSQEIEREGEVWPFDGCNDQAVRGAEIVVDMTLGSAAFEYDLLWQVCNLLRRTWEV